MEVNRKGNQINIVLDSEDEAVGIYMFLAGRVHEIPVDAASKGQWLYGWLFNSIEKLATNFGKERSVSTMSGENSPPRPVDTNPKKAKKR